MHKIVLEVSPSALPTWRLLPQCVRWHVGAFPDISTSTQAGPHGSVESLALRTMSAQSDVVEVATRLTTAFPQLVRRVTAVAVNTPILVSLECEGMHEGMWGDIIHPTRRRVVFEEQHEIVAVDGRIVSDRITLDLPAILSQLCGDGLIDPDETARMGRVRRELHERAKGSARQSQ
jgi:hypothetical protein